jgi:hypothetical protein
METETVLHSTRGQHTSCSSEHIDDLRSVTSAGHLEERIPATDPGEIAFLWSAVRAETRGPEDLFTSTKSSVSPTIKAFQESNKGGKLDRPTKCSRPQMTSNSILHGVSANIASSQVGRTPQLMSCDIRIYTIAVVSAHEYFNSKLKKALTSGAATPQGSSEPDKDTKFYKAIADEYSFLAVCKSSQDAFSNLTNDRFLQLSSLGRDILTQEQLPKAIKVNTSGACHLHDKWQEPRDTNTTGNRTTQPSSSYSPFACTFWLCLRVFDPPIRKFLNSYTYDLGGRVVFPYLTVDFRHKDEQLYETRYRAARLGTQALLSRHRVFLETRDLVGAAAAGARDDAIHRHFVIIFDAASYEGWQITVDDGEGKWMGNNGCAMSRIFDASLLKAECVKDLYEWMREIHCWGVGKYGPGCGEEIWKCLRAAQGY